MRVIARCAVLAFVLALAAGPGATSALADPAKDKHAQAHSRPASHRAATARPKARPKAKAHAEARPKAKKSHEREESGGFLTPNFRPPAAFETPSVLEPLCTDCLTVSAKPTKAPHHGKGLLAVGPLTITAVESPVTSVLIKHPAKTSAVSLLQLTPPAELGQTAARRAPTLTLGAAHIELPAGHATRAAVRGQALPAQGPASIGGRLSGASGADVPIFVAVIGLLLLTLGARGVGRFRRPVDDTDLTWD